MAKGKDLMVRKEFDSFVDEFFGGSFRNNLWDRFVGGFLNKPLVEDFSVFQSKGTFPKVNVSEDEKSFTVEIATAGFTKDELDLSLDDGVLYIKAHSCKNTEADERKYLVREIACRKFTRCVRFPTPVDDASIDASYKDGVVTLVVNKSAVEEKPVKKIEVK